MSTGFNRWFTRTSRPVRNAAAAKMRRTSLRLEELEDRAVPTVFTVNTLSDIAFTGIGTTGDTVNKATGAINNTHHLVTLRSAIEAANATAGGNTIKLVLPGSYRLTLAGTAGESDNLAGELAILPGGGNLTIVGTGRQSIDAGHHFRVFDINPNDDVTTADAFTVSFRKFRIIHGLASSAANPDGGGASGGGIRAQGIASLALTSMTLAGNSASADGGGIAMENTVSAPWTLTVTSSLVEYDHAGDAGGGIETDGLGTLTVTNSTLSNNTSVNQGGGIWLDDIANGSKLESATLLVKGSLIANNQSLAATNNGANNGGGGIGDAGDASSFNGTVTGITILNCTIADNYAAGVGGGFGDQGNAEALTIQNSLIIDNSSGIDGGGVFASGTSVTILHSEISSNTTGENGGGLFVGGSLTNGNSGTADTELTLTGSSIVHDTAADFNGSTLTGGGGIELETTSTASTITTTTIADNEALNNGGANGGGIDLSASFTGSVTLLNDTINDNVATQGGGVYWNAAQSPTSHVILENTLIAQNFADAGTLGDGPDITGGTSLHGFTDDGGNLIGINDSVVAVGLGGNPNSQVGTPSHPIDPLLATLGNYGGPTVGSAGHTLVLETEVLDSGSPGSGKGVTSPLTPPTLDERGDVFLIHGKIDVGAVSS
jgi:hypothetical protein